MTREPLQFSRESQKETIKRHLLNGGKLTSLSALRLAGSLRCSERIREIQAEGIAIHKEWITVNGKRVLEYSLERNTQ
jgi:hypothetical protein